MLERLQSKCQMVEQPRKGGEEALFDIIADGVLDFLSDGDRVLRLRGKGDAVADPLHEAPAGVRAPLPPRQRPARLDVVPVPILVLQVLPVVRA